MVWGYNNRDMIDTYRNFEDLAAHTTEGVDYRISARKVDDHYLIMAIHGGNIEPFTSEIALAMAGDDHSLYLFEGIKEKGNAGLHITSEYFNEPRAKDMARNAEVIVSIHGQHDMENEFVMIGGLCEGLAEKIAAHLREIDIAIQPADPLLAGTSPDNICNKGVTQGGVQLEISRKLRNSLREDAGLFRLFTNAVRHAIAAYHIG